MGLMLIADFHTKLPGRNGDVIAVNVPVDEFPAVEKIGGIGISVSVTFSGDSRLSRQKHCEAICLELDKIKERLRSVISGEKVTPMVDSSAKREGEVCHQQQD